MMFAVRELLMRMRSAQGHGKRVLMQQIKKERVLPKVVGPFYISFYLLLFCFNFLCIC